MQRAVKPSEFLRPEESDRIQQAIAAAEQATTAEIKFVICRFCWGNIRDKAVSVFRQFNLHRTRERNCVLILLVTANREFVIYGDRGINAKVRPDFWQQEKDSLERAFREDLFGDGIAATVESIGARLAEFFPATGKNDNEISNEVGYAE